MLAKIARQSETLVVVIAPFSLPFSLFLFFYFSLLNITNLRNLDKSEFVKFLRKLLSTIATDNRGAHFSFVLHPVKRKACRWRVTQRNIRHGERIHVDGYFFRGGAHHGPVHPSLSLQPFVVLFIARHSHISGGSRHQFVSHEIFHWTDEETRRRNYDRIFASGQKDQRN